MKIVDSSVLEKWYAKEYESCDMNGLFGEPREEVAGFIRGLPGGSGAAIELGCGDGRNLSLLAQKGYKITGVDMVDSTVQSRLTNAWLQNLRFMKGNILDLNLEHAAYDVLLCTEVLHFFEKKDLDALMPKIISTLKPGGYLFLDLLSDLTRFFQASGEPFVWDKEASMSIFESESFFEKWLGDFEIYDIRHFFDKQSWPLSDAEHLPVDPYTWQGTYVSVCAQKRSCKEMV
ncbi:bifunctional 2-polyprenyl-6-hydroxyphenol methylase/3-demethylubiquinol 3-O-methyltransferase UbiG [Ectopseudomonas oleovorans]|uniref:Methyltransferase family protein n=1 Tax=Ectopseudomonas oleovorans TaxID=301 RepID=A0A3D9EBR8_ECTOL|nr:class I SAM-dependent methyltransferase [Pseudomonas oleovorans]RED00448.1 methyltransferase family protein [Pseudomonas oleovorans]